MDEEPLDIIHLTLLLKNWPNNRRFDEDGDDSDLAIPHFGVEQESTLSTTGSVLRYLIPRKGEGPIESAGHVSEEGERVSRQSSCPNEFQPIRSHAVESWTASNDLLLNMFNILQGPASSDTSSAQSPGLLRGLAVHSFYSGDYANTQSFLRKLEEHEEGSIDSRLYEIHSDIMLDKGHVFIWQKSKVIDSMIAETNGVISDLHLMLWCYALRNRPWSSIMACRAVCMRFPEDGDDDLCLRRAYSLFMEMAARSMQVIKSGSKHNKFALRSMRVVISKMERLRSGDETADGKETLDKAKMIAICCNVLAYCCNSVGMHASAERCANDGLQVVRRHIPGLLHMRVHADLYVTKALSHYGKKDHFAARRALLRALALYDRGCDFTTDEARDARLQLAGEFDDGLKEELMKETCL